MPAKRGTAFPFCTDSAPYRRRRTIFGDFPDFRVFCTLRGIPHGYYSVSKNICLQDLPRILYHIFLFCATPKNINLRHTRINKKHGETAKDVCDEYLCCSIQDGIDVLSFGNTAENETDYIWKHPEMLDVKAYRRFLCFSKQAEDEIYFLLSEDGSVKYGTVYVLRSPLGKVHYYYRRFCGNMKAEYFDGISSENIVFSCEGKTYDLKHHCSFVSDIDFTKGRDTLCVNGEPCVFSPILPY